MRFCFLLFFLPVVFLGCVAIPRGLPVDPNATPVLFENFSKAQEAPASWMVLNGAVALNATNRNRFLSLPAEPLEPHGVMFGPVFRDGLRVAARFNGKKKGRQSPTFGVGLNGISGYRLQVNPGQKKLELLRNEMRMHAVDFEWNAEGWTYLMLQVRELPGLQWAVEGKAWTATEKMPEAWSLSWKDAGAPLPGRPSAWATPYSGKPVAVDDVQVWRID